MTSTRPPIAALVPMKGHSERVPGKNLRPLSGRPLYRWVVDALFACGRVDRVVIDTDSESIAEDVGSTYGPRVEIVWRPDRLRGDLVPMHDILAFDITQIPEDVFLQTHATNPLLTPQTIAAAVDAFLDPGDHDSLFTVTPLHTRLYWPDGRPVNHDPSQLLRTQDLPPVLEENSNLYLFTRPVMERTGRRIGAKPLLHPVAAREALDIDEELDFLIADLLMRRRDPAESVS